MSKKLGPNDPASAVYRRELLGTLYPDRDVDLSDDQLEAIPQSKIDELSINAPPMKDWAPSAGSPPPVNNEPFNPRNIDYDHAMDVKGRIGATNLGDESDPGTIKKLQEKNPGTSFHQEEGHLFAKNPGDAQWHPFRTDSFQWQHPTSWGQGNPASDHIADIAKPVISTLATVMGHLPLTGPKGAVIQGGMAGGLESLRQELGMATGYRSQMDPKQIELNAAGGALIPVIGAGMGAPIIRKLGQAVGSEGLANVAGAPGSLAGLLGRGVSKVGGLASGYSSELLDKFLDPTYSAVIKKWTGLEGAQALQQATDEATQPILKTAADSRTYMGKQIRGLNDKSPGTISTQWVMGPDGNPIQGPLIALRKAIQGAQSNLGPGASQAMQESKDATEKALWKYLPLDENKLPYNVQSTPSQLFENEQQIRELVRPKTSMGQLVNETPREIKSAATDMQTASKALRQRSVLDQNPGYTQEQLNLMDSKYGIAADQDDAVHDAFTAINGTGSDMQHAVAAMDRLATGTDPALRANVTSILGPEGNPALEAEAGNAGRMNIDQFNDKVNDLKNSGLYYGDEPGLRPGISPKLMAIRGILKPKRVMQLNELLGSMGAPIENPGVGSSAYRQLAPNYLNYKYEEDKQ